MMETNTFAAVESARYCLATRTNNLYTTSEKQNFLNGTHQFLRNEEGINFDQCNKIVQIFLLIGQIYESRGYVREAQYYYNQGLILSIHTFSRFYVIDFLANLGDIEKRRHQNQSALQYLAICTAVNRAIWERMGSEDIVRVQCILSMCQLADMYRTAGSYEKTHEMIEEAKQRADKIQPKRLENLHSPTKMKKIISEDGFNISSIKGMIILQEALLSFAEGEKEEGEFKLLEIAKCSLPQREKVFTNYKLVL
jgi:tetratricopeptide (TPR) repeat protein